MKPKDPKQFAKDFRKSIDFDDVTVSIPDDQQHYAEEMASPENIELLQSYVADLAVGDVTRFYVSESFTLTISKKAEGLFSAFVSDANGQVVQKYTDATIAILVKDMELKGYMIPDLGPAPEECLETEYQESAPPAIAPVTCIRISLGELQIEISKSLQIAIDTPQHLKKDVKKALEIFRKSASSYLETKNDKEAAREILGNWHLHGERFNQILFGIEQVKKGKQR